MKVLLIDDDPLVTSGIQLIIEQGTKDTADPIQVCGIGSDGSQVLSLYRQQLPDIVLMDIRMKKVNGIEAGIELIKYYPQAKIIYLTTFLEDDYIISALKNGAKGYILKTDFHTLIPAINAVYNGQSVFGQEIITRMPDFLSHNEVSHQTISHLSDRENELLYLLAQGLNNKEIAETLHFSEGTVRNYISDLLTKLELRDRTQLAIYYYKNIHP